MHLIIGSSNSHKVREISQILAGLGGIECVPFTDLEPMPEIEETGKTFAENAALKALTLAQYLRARDGAQMSGRHTAVDSGDTHSFERLAAERAREAREGSTNQPTSGRFGRVTGSARIRAGELLILADDSGIQVDALKGAPGVMSARYAGVHGDDDGNNAKLLRELEGVAPDKRSARFVCAISLATPSEVLFTVEGRVEGRIARKPEGKLGFGYDPLFFYPPFGKTFGQVSPEQKNSVSHRSEALKQFRLQFERLLKMEGRL